MKSGLLWIPPSDRKGQKRMKSSVKNGANGLLNSVQWIMKEIEGQTDDKEMSSWGVWW